MAAALAVLPRSPRPESRPLGARPYAAARPSVAVPGPPGAALPPNRRCLPTASVRRRGARARARGGGGAGECGARRVLPCPRRAPPAGRRPSSSSRATRCGRSPTSSRRTPIRARSSTRWSQARGTAAVAAGRDDHLARRLIVPLARATSTRDGALPWVVRCPYCRENDDKVVDSRVADEGGAIRRRRECLACGRRYTTYERVEEVGARRAQAVGRSTSPSTASQAARRASSGRRRTGSTPATIDAVVAEVEEELRDAGRRGRRASGSAWPCSSACGASTTSPTCGSRRSTRASRTSPTSSARSASSRRRPRPSSGSDGRGASRASACASRARVQTFANALRPGCFADPESVDEGVTTVL